ncbi:hypothetical protein SAMN05444487_10337 [Marininema mesophilum]|uniref:Uncharacterized protein n=1 Tax=Marininema mesophilum TaxID=1048340 RepID=A0A1H2T7Q3_9BACL|nr:hypothetical protein SAMN05444487_10337 [Marininema mesophilum]
MSMLINIKMKRLFHIVSMIGVISHILTKYVIEGVPNEIITIAYIILVCGVLGNILISLALRRESN